MAWSDESLTPPSQFPMGNLSTNKRVICNDPDNGDFMMITQGANKLTLFKPTIRQIISSPAEPGLVPPVVRPVKGAVEGLGGGGSERPDTPGLLWPRGS